MSIFRSKNLESNAQVDYGKHEYDEVISKVLGAEALVGDKTAMELIGDNIPFGGMIVVDDGSDLGYVSAPHFPSAEERNRNAARIMDALARSRTEIPD